MTELASDRIYYAIGDIHGLADRLRSLHEAIFDHHALFHEGRPFTIVHLGDYIDRGPDSAGVIATIRTLEAKAEESGQFEVVSLKGNHEQMMLDGLTKGFVELAFWLKNGGRETLASFGINPDINDQFIEALPDGVMDWLSGLPDIHFAHNGKLVFVHGGVEPETFPHCSSEAHLWTRSARFFDTSAWSTYEAMQNVRIVHGHTPTKDFKADLTADKKRLNLDTGAVFGGALTAGILDGESDVRFLSA